MLQMCRKALSVQAGMLAPSCWQQKEHIQEKVKICSEQHSGGEGREVSTGQGEDERG